MKKSISQAIALICLTTTLAKAQVSQFEPPIAINDLKATNIIDIKHVDLDSDGVLDLVFASADQIRWCKGLGEGEFGDSEQLRVVDHYRSYQDLTSFDVGDVDADGDMDIIYGDNLHLFVLKNDGIENFEWLDFSFWKPSKQIKITDHFVNGRPEIILGGSIDKLIRLTFEADVLKKSDAEPFGGIYFEYLDFDGNENPDVLTFDNYLLSIFFDYPELNSRMNTGLNPGYTIDNISILDVNNDSFTDVVIQAIIKRGGTTTTQLMYFENDSNKVFMEPVESELFDFGFNSMVPLDVDKDGELEIVASTSPLNKAGANLSYFEIDLIEGFSEMRPLFEDANQSDVLKKLDIDEDGIEDLVGISRLEDYIGWYKAHSDGSFGDFKIITESLIPTPLQMKYTDIDQDGLNDLVVASPGRNKALTWYKNLGDFEFELGGIIESDLSGVSKLEIGDLNADGLEDMVIWIGEVIQTPYDIISTSRFKSEVYWYENLGNTAFSERHFVARDTSVSSDISLFHFDDNAALDIAFIGDQLQVYTYQQSDGGMNRTNVPGVDSMNIAISIFADINNDAMNELFVINYTDSTDISRGFPITRNYNQMCIVAFDTVISVNLDTHYRINAMVAMNTDNDIENEIILGASSNDFRFNPRVQLFEVDFSEPFSPQVELLDLSASDFIGLAAMDINGDGMDDIVASKPVTTTHSVDMPYQMGGGIHTYINDGMGAFNRIIQPDSNNIYGSDIFAGSFEIGDRKQGISYSRYRDWIKLYPSFQGTAVSNSMEEDVPQKISLSQNYPNPFNPATTITYQLPVSSAVKVTVFDVLGREVAVLVDERLTAGTHQIRFDGAALASGVYMYRLEVGNQVQTRKMVLIK